MGKRIARFAMALFGALVGIALISTVDEVLRHFGDLGLNDLLLTWAMVLVYVAGGIVIAIIFYIFSPKLIDACIKLLSTLEHKLSELELATIFLGVMGLIIGLFTAFLASTLMAGVALYWLRLLINAMLYLFLGYLGWSVVVKRRSEINMPNWFRRSHDKNGTLLTAARPKVLDTSVIIDGRIADICATGIIEGEIIVPAFVLQELRHIADSADGLKRNRGRRGLDILNHMQEEEQIPIKVLETDYDDIDEVDAKLIRLAYELDGVVVTNDFNLNKVAGVQRIAVFNINDLANAVKPVLLPGEDMSVVIVKEGKEPGQGVAYLDDGTMIVVEGGRKLIGEQTQISVTSVLQTSAGRMIFAKLKG